MITDLTDKVMDEFVRLIRFQPKDFRGFLVIFYRLEREGRLGRKILVVSQ